MPSEALQKGLVPVRRMVTRAGKTFMTTVYVGSTKKDRDEQSHKTTALALPSQLNQRRKTRDAVAIMEHTEDIIDYAPDDHLLVDKLLAFQREFYKDHPKDISPYDLLETATKEVEWALAQTGDTGKDWYGDSMKTVRSILSTHVSPDLASDEEWDFFLAILAITSPTAKPMMNLKIAVKVYDEYTTTGKVPLKDKTTGKAFSLSSTSNLKNLSKWLKSVGSKSEFVQFINGVSSSGELRDKGATISGKVDESAFNSMVFGEKIGMFYQSLRGTEGAVAVDRWAIRTFYRWAGKLSEFVSVDSLSGKKSRVVTETVTPEDRRSIEYVMQTVGEKLGLSSSETQSVLWYYEKRLYKKLGMAAHLTDVDDYATAAKKLYLKKSRDPSILDRLFTGKRMPTFDAVVAAVMEVKR